MRGPISVHSFMKESLNNPEYGYYTRPQNPIFGSQGDFTTSPEISQVFGEVRK